jgi:hypothetical protein
MSWRKASIFKVIDYNALAAAEMGRSVKTLGASKSSSRKEVDDICFYLGYICIQ